MGRFCRQRKCHPYKALRALSVEQFFALSVQILGDFGVILKTLTNEMIIKNENPCYLVKISLSLPVAKNHYIVKI